MFGITRLGQAEAGARRFSEFFHTDAGFQAVGPSFTDFPGTLTGDWRGSGVNLG